jgi:hypothetical protein
MTETEMMAIWTKLATPGAEHELLGRYVGEWKVVMKGWMDPHQPPTEGKGRASIAALHGGRVRTEKFGGEMMGMPFEGWGMVGFDNATQKYWMTWTDNMSTGLMYSAEGALSPDKKTLTYFATMDKPATGEKNVRVKYVYRLIDDNHFDFESYELPKTGEIKTLEIHYTRQ